VRFLTDATSRRASLAIHNSLPVVVDDLDVVPVRVEHERAVAARVIDGALAWRAVVLVARRERGGVEQAGVAVYLMVIVSRCRSRPWVSFSV
jgi:hypothetical protein